jgi:hypothetical protein
MSPLHPTLKVSLCVVVVFLALTGCAGQVTGHNSSSAAIGIGLFLFDSALARFGGLSGLAYGCTAYLALLVIQCRSRAKVYAWGILIALVLKILADLIEPTPVIELFGAQAFVGVPLSHLIGVQIAGFFHIAAVPVHYRRDPPARSPSMQA